ncbi:class I SAM-dependent methyltransferase [candidate division KSB1 bacterium]
MLYKTSQFTGKVGPKILRRGFEEVGLDHVLQKDIRLLDAGCGPGYFLKHMHDKFPNIDLYGVDISGRGTYMASVIAPEAKILRADFQRLPFRDESFDIVHSSCIFDESIGHGKKFEPFNMIWQVYRVLKEGGIYFVVDINVGDKPLSDELAYLEDFFNRKSECVFVKEE